MSKEKSGISNNVPATQKPGAVAKSNINDAVLTQMSAATETGFEGTSSADYAIPFIALLQKLSPQVDESDDAHVAGAKVGMFYNASTGELLNELRVIPCHYKHSVVEWRPNRGGFVAQHPEGADAGLPRNDKGQAINSQGNLMVDTRYFFCLSLNEDGSYTQCILSFASTQLKKAKNWMSRMSNMKVSDGKRSFTPPMFSHIWKLSSMDEENEKGAWKGYKMELEGPISTADLFDAAKSSRVVFQTAQVTPPSENVVEEATTAGEKKM